MKAQFVHDYSLVGAPTVDDDCARFAKALEAMADYFNLSPDERENLHSNTYLLRSALLNGGAPHNYWKPLGSGAFKECYALMDSPKFIVKFASQHNRTPAEIEILEKADRAGLSALFLPTYFAPLNSTTLPADLLDEQHANDSDRWTYDSADGECVEREDWEAPVLKYIEVQPRISRISHGKDTMLEQKEYEETPWRDPRTGKDIPWQVVYDTAIQSRDWLAAVIRIYGVDMLYRLADFAVTNYIYDLHDSNTGYLLKDGIEYPVIIDWLSA